MRILLTGGGSGGHVTPLLAVAHELKTLRPDVELVYVGEKKGGFGRLAEESGLFEHTSYIWAGKLRRYHDQSLLQRIFDVKTNALNVRDAFRTLRGVFQALSVMKKYRPQVVFIKGGFVGVPIGLAAALLSIPFVTHDSDAVPGLANRIIARWARLHATGLPIEFYSYPKDKTVFVGIPTSNVFRPATTTLVQDAKAKLDIPKKSKVVVVTGGSQGSKRINDAVHKIVPQLLKDHQDLCVIHHVGQKHQALYDDFSHKRLKFAAFFDDFASVATAADIIVTRAGANSMAEFGVLGKATIVVPSPFLAGGHQMKNAKLLAEEEAIVEIDETALRQNSELLAAAIEQLLANDERRQQLAANLSKITKIGAAKQIATLLVELSIGRPTT